MSDNSPDQSPPLGWLNHPANWQDSELEDTDAAFLVLPDLDYDSQVVAIKVLLARHREADGQMRSDIERIREAAKRTSGIRNERAVEDWAGRLEDSVYQGAAHSMAAIGMIAPLLESIFFQSFMNAPRYLGKEWTPPSPGARWAQLGDDAWDCHYIWTGRRAKNIILGIAELSDDLGLSKHLPTDISKTLDAVFGYRNKMFHGGFEWLPEERAKFTKRIESEWPANWFSTSTSAGDPWIFYMTDEFIDHCIEAVEGVIGGIGRWCKETLTAGE